MEAHRIDSSRRCANCAHVDPEFGCLQMVSLADGSAKPADFACHEHQTQAEHSLDMHRPAGPVLLLAAALLAGCGPANPPAASDSAASAVAQHQTGGDNGLLWGLGGFLLGRATAPSPAPAVAPVPPAPVYVDRRTVVQATPRPATPPAPPKPPVVSTSPRVPPPMPTAAPKPSYSGPSGYRSVTQSAPSYSRSFSAPSSGRR